MIKMNILNEYSQWVTCVLDSDKDINLLSRLILKRIHHRDVEANKVRKHSWSLYLLRADLHANVHHLELQPDPLRQYHQ